MLIAITAAQLEVIERVTLDCFEMVRLELLESGPLPAREFAHRIFSNLACVGDPQDIEVLTGLLAAGVFTRLDPHFELAGRSGVCVEFGAAGAEAVAAALLGPEPAGTASSPAGC